MPTITLAEDKFKEVNILPKYLVSVTWDSDKFGIDLPFKSDNVTLDKAEAEDLLKALKSFLGK